MGPACSMPKPAKSLMMVFRSTTPHGSSSSSSSSSSCLAAPTTSSSTPSPSELPTVSCLCRLSSFGDDEQSPRSALSPAPARPSFPPSLVAPLPKDDRPTPSPLMPRASSRSTTGLSPSVFRSGGGGDGDVARSAALLARFSISLASDKLSRQICRTSRVRASVRFVRWWSLLNSQHNPDRSAPGQRELPKNQASTMASPVAHVE